ncbi:MAG: T9SS type A sorting domain-containing protein [Bacteroidales bacterium]
MKKNIFLLLLITIFLKSSVAQWKPTNGPKGGENINSIAISGSKIVAGTGNGAYLSIDNGLTWTEISPPSGGVLSVAFCGTTLFAGTYGWGIYKSTNYGATWTSVNMGLPSYVIARTLAVSGTTVYVGLGGNGVYKTTNNGASWTATNTGITTSDVWSLTIDGANIYAAAYLDGVYLSSNNGATWTAVNTGISFLAMTAMAHSGSHIYAGSHNSVYSSTNNGATWAAINSGLGSTYIQTLAATDSTIYAGTNNGIYKSTNYGASWISASDGLTCDDVKSFAIDGAKVYAGTQNGGGFFVSTDYGAYWKIIGVKKTRVYTMVVNDTTILAGSYNQGIYQLTLGDTIWNAINSGLTNAQIRSLLISGNDIFAGTYGGGVFISSNNGASWTETNLGLPYLKVMALAKCGSKIFAGTENDGIYVSQNNGLTWSAANSGLTNTKIRSFAVIGTKIFAGTYGGGAFLSTNNGASWQAVNNGLTCTIVFAMAIRDTCIYAGTNAGVFSTNDYGTNWIARNAGLPNTMVWSLAIKDSNIIAGTSGGIFISPINGTGWNNGNAGLVSPNILSIAINGVDIYAGIGDDGVYKHSLLFNANDETICAGACATLSVSQALGSDSATTFSWNNGLTGSTITVCPGSTTTYTVTGTNNGITDIAQAKVTVNPKPTIFTNGGTICADDSLTLYVYGANTYVWNTGDSLDEITVAPPDTTVYTVIGFKDGIGCSDTAQATVIVNPIPVTPVVTENWSTLTSSAVAGNQWYLDNSFIFGANNQNYYCTLDGDYYTIVTLNGCTSDTSNIIHVVNAKVDEITNGDQCFLFPNPATKKLIIELPHKSEIEISNTEGQIIKKLVTLENKTDIDVSGFPSGVYIIKATFNEGSMMKKFIKN